MVGLVALDVDPVQVVRGAAALDRLGHDAGLKGGGCHHFAVFPAAAAVKVRGAGAEEDRDGSGQGLAPVRREEGRGHPGGE